MKHIPLNKIYIILAILLILFLTFIISCTNVKNNQFTTGKKSQDTITKTIDIDNEASETEVDDVVIYIPLPDWQHYDLNPSSSHYKEIYGINKFKDEKIVLAFQQVP